MFQLAAAAISGHKFFTVQKFIFGLQMPAGNFLSRSPLPYFLSFFTDCTRSPGISPYLCATHLTALHENLLQNGQSLNGYRPLSMTVNLTQHHRILTWIC